METQATTLQPASKKKKLLKRLGAASFLFFLIKGLVWLGAAAWIAIKAKG